MFMLMRCSNSFNWELNSGSFIFTETCQEVNLYLMTSTTRLELQNTVILVTEKRVTNMVLMLRISGLDASEGIPNQKNTHL